MIPHTPCSHTHTQVVSAVSCSVMHSRTPTSRSSLSTTPSLTLTTWYALSPPVARPAPNRLCRSTCSSTTPSTAASRATSRSATASLSSRATRSPSSPRRTPPPSPGAPSAPPTSSSPPVSSPLSRSKHDVTDPRGRTI
ncbi:hypothetical protein EIP86_005740 [Pleurotus ostreatoroseus]|nr:hypothetical protein EIP86_005740 [Pleurotus ostreatoroseus]